MSGVRLKWLKNVGWKERLFGVKCPHCQKRGDIRDGNYARGYNEWCTQASGDDGLYCMECSGITFFISQEESRRITPTWCTVLPDSPKRRWFPDFKHNRSVAHIPTHASHAADAK